MTTLIVLAGHGGKRRLPMLLSNGFVPHRSLGNTPIAELYSACVWDVSLQNIAPLPRQYADPPAPVGSGHPHMQHEVCEIRNPSVLRSPQSPQAFEILWRDVLIPHRAEAFARITKVRSRGLGAPRMASQDSWSSWHPVAGLRHSCAPSTQMTVVSQLQYATARMMVRLQTRASVIADALLSWS
jgi:hypothetical protein